MLKLTSVFCGSSFILSISLILVGAMIWASGSRLPEYNDPNWEEPFNDPSWTAHLDVAFDKDTHGDRKDFDAMCGEWYAAQARARTARDDRMDYGIGIAALGVGTGMLITATRAWRLHDLCDVTTPRTPVRFYLLASLVWLSFIQTEWAWYDYTSDRGDYPPFADVVFIPQAGTFLFVVVSLPFILAGVWIAIHGAKLPVRVWARPVFGRSYFLSPVLWGAAIMAAALIIYGVRARPYDVPTCVFMLYLILSGRAAAVTRKLEG